MSHSSGTVTFPDGTVFHILYSGTYNCVEHPALWDTPAEAWDHLDQSVERECTCGNPPEIARLHSEYGRGDEWEVPACKRCRVLLDCRSHSEILLADYEANRRGLFD